MARIKQLICFGYRHQFEIFKYLNYLISIMRVKINKYIVADSEICHGKPTFAGTRIMVHSILEMLEGEASFKDILDAYPSLRTDHIKAALHYAAERLAGEQFVDIKT